jgi:hypothetical protein
MQKRLAISFAVAALALGAGLPVGAADVSYLAIVKSQNYAQAPGGAPTILASNGYAFAAVVVGATNNLVLGATVKPPNPTPVRTLMSDTNGGLWQFIDATNSSTALDALYPGGFASYTLTLQTTNDGTKTVTLSFGFASAPPTPQIGNLPAAQDLDSTAAFTLQWAALGNSFTIVQLTVLDRASNTVFSTPAPLQPGALSGANTSVVIAAHSLPPGATLTGMLSAGNPGLPNTSYGTGLAALARITTFPLVTRALAPPRLTVLAPTDNPFQFRLNGETNVNYEILSATNLASWTLWLTTNSPTGVVDLSAPRAPGTERRFYRARAVQ